MSLAKKLQLNDGQKLRVLNAPKGLNLAVPAANDGEAVLVFAKDVAELEAHGGPALEAAKADVLAWIAYPKAGQLETDLNRDILWKHLEGRGVQPVRQVALDDVWSALRFRPA